MSFFAQNHINPAMDFTQTPPGMLALDNMLYLAKVHQDTYIRVKAGAGCPRGCPFACLPSPSLTPSPRPQIVLENSSREDKHECPFGRSAIELTKMLCEILQVGELREYEAPLHAHSLCSGPVRPKSATLGVSATGQPSWAFFILVTEWAVIRLPLFMGVVAVACLSW